MTLGDGRNLSGARRKSFMGAALVVLAVTTSCSRESVGTAADAGRARASLEVTPPDIVPTEIDIASAAVLELQAEVATTAAAAREARSEAVSAEIEVSSLAAGIAPGIVTVDWTGRGVTRTLFGHDLRISTGQLPDASPQEHLVGLLERHGRAFGITDPADAYPEMTVRESYSEPGIRVIRAFQHHRGLPIFDAALLVQLTPSGEIKWVTGHPVPQSALPDATPSVSADQAAAVLGLSRDTTELGWFDPELHTGETGEIRLAWRGRLDAPDGGYHVFVDAVTGRELHRKTLTADHQHREIFTANMGVLPGTLQLDTTCHTSGDATCPTGWCSGGVCQTPAWVGSASSVNVSTASVYSYWFVRHGRDSWDNGLCGTAGHPCTDPNLHRMRATANAGQCGRWSRIQDSPPAQVVISGASYGLDILGHEFTHGLANAEAGPAVSLFAEPVLGHCPGCSMAESFSDMFGEFVEQLVTGTTDWANGVNNPPCDARNLSNPPADLNVCETLTSHSSPDNHALYRPCTVVHWGSTVTSKAGYLMSRDPASGPVTHWGISTTGVGISQASHIWYDVLTNRLSNVSSFAQFRDAFTSSCLDLLSGSTETNCLGPHQAIGLWTGDALTGWTVDDAVAVSRHWVSGAPRNYVLYKLPSSTSLVYRYRTCWPWDGGCSWGFPISIANTSSAPAATTFGGSLWTCYRNTVGTLECGRITSTGSFATGPSPGDALVGAPSLVVHNGLLYVAFRRSDSTIAWRRYDGTSWSAVFTPGITSSDPPTLASSTEDPVVGGINLWMVYRRSSDGRVAYRKFLDGTTNWGTERLAGPASGPASPTPTTAGRSASRMHRGRLHVAARDPSGTLRHMSCPMPCSSSTDWTPWVRQDGVGAEAALTLDGSLEAGRLYLWYRAAGGQNLQFRYKVSE